MDDRTGPVSQLNVAGDEIGVEMREEHVRDSQAVLVGERDVLIDIPLRIDNGRDAGPFVTDEVGRVGQAVQVKLFQDHLPFLIRLIVNAAALWVATQLVPGVSYAGTALPFFGVATIFGVVNAFIRPVMKILTFPFILLTLGLFSLVVNGLMLWLTSSLSGSLGFGFHVAGFWAAFWGALVVSLVSMLLSATMER